MIRNLVDFSLNNRYVVLAVGVLLLLWGAVSFHNMPVEVYPDIADNYVNVISQWPGHSAEEMEQQVSVPVEIQVFGIPHLTTVRSESIFGLSLITLIFDDQSVNDWNRQKVLERLTQVNMPAGVVPQIGTDWSPTGQIYWYTIRSTNPAYDLMNLRSIEDWTLYKEFRKVPNVVDVSDFGGTAREYQVRVDPNKLITFGLSISQVENQLATNNVNAGGSFVEEGLQQLNVRALGLYRNVQDIENTVLTTSNGAPVRVKDVAVVEWGPRIRLGHMARADHRPDGVIVDEPDVIQGGVLMRKGAEESPTLEAIHQKVDELNNHILPEGVKVIPMLDRSDLLHYTLHTVLHNLGEGMILVTIILFLFLGNVRGAFIVALTIPFSLLFASIFLNLSHIPANLISLGALDFGMVVDGAVVMMENIMRHLGHHRNDESPEAGRITMSLKTPIEMIRDAAHEVQRPVFFAVGIIITAYMPIFTLQRVEGRLFRPMAWTVAFALLGAIVFSIFLVPVLAALLFPHGVREWRNPVMEFLKDRYRGVVKSAIENRWITVGLALVSLAVAAFLTFSGIIGSEFLPHLDEGAIWARGAMANSVGETEGTRFTEQNRKIFASFPEVTKVVSQAGAPDDGTDTGGFGNTEYFIDLKPKDQWRPIFHENKEELIAAMDREVEKHPGAFWNFSQPIEDNVDETMTGTKGGLCAKLYGPELDVLEAKGEQIKDVMANVDGVKDLGIQRDTGQPNIDLTVDRKAAARFGINVADVQDAIQTAVGGNSVSQVLQGEAVYNVVVRYLKPYRDTKEAIQNIRLLAPSGERVSLSQVTNAQVRDDAYDIYREDGSRYVAIRFEVRGRDLGTTVKESIAKIAKNVQIPRGYHLEWSGEYDSETRAEKRLLFILPLTIFFIFIILYTMFRSFKWALLIILNVAMAPTGGLLALLLTGTFFSVSSGVGFLALFGVSVQTGVIMLEYINQLRARGYTAEGAAIEGAVLRLRPIMMTMLVATLGLLPAAMSHAIGSDSQRPFAIVIVGGLMASLAMSIFLLPTLYVWIAREGDRLPKAEVTGEV
jgi:cobalt-zinc-cadmium resistance protein CzcA